MYYSLGITPKGGETVYIQFLEFEPSYNTRYALALSYPQGATVALYRGASMTEEIEYTGDRGGNHD